MNNSQSSKEGGAESNNKINISLAYISVWMLVHIFQMENQSVM